MPFKSKAQMKWMFANMPQTAEKWAKHTPNIKSLPEKINKIAKKLAKGGKNVRRKRKKRRKRG